VQAGGPRDQGTAIRSQTGIDLARGIQQIAGGIEGMARQRVEEQAQSDMSAFQAERIRREQAFRESSATITNSEKYRKAVDKHITDLNKYAAGPREDGTKVFRNGMGTAAQKEFNKGYSAKFQTAGSEHAFQLDRKRDKLNYRISINSGIKNNNPDAITQSYEQLVNSGLLTAEEATIEKERDMKSMTLNYFAETQATMMLGVDEALNQTTDLKQTGETIKGAFENYKNEVYTNKNLNDQERKSLIDNAKASLKALEYKNRAQKSQAKHQGEVNTNMAVHEWQTAILNGEDPEEASRKSHAKWGTNIDPKAQTKFFDRAMKHSDQKAKAAKDQKQADMNRSLDLSLAHRIRKYDPANDPTGKEWTNLNEDAAFMFSSSMKSISQALLKEQNPTDPNSKSPLGEFTRASNQILSDVMGMELTRTERKDLKGARTRAPASGWFGSDFTDADIAKHENSTEEFQDYLAKSEREELLNGIMTEASEIYKKDPSAAKVFINDAKDKLQKETNDRIYYNQYFKANPYDMIKRK